MGGCYVKATLPTGVRLQRSTPTKASINRDRIRVPTAHFPDACLVPLLTVASEGAPRKRHVESPEEQSGARSYSQRAAVHGSTSHAPMCGAPILQPGRHFGVS